MIFAKHLIDSASAQLMDKPCSLSLILLPAEKLLRHANNQIWAVLPMQVVSHSSAAVSGRTTACFALLWRPFKTRYLLNLVDTFSTTPRNFDNFVHNHFAVAEA